MRAVRAGLSDAAPIVYLEMIVLPRQGMPYRPLHTMAGYESWLMFEMLRIEADNYVPPKVD